MRFAYKSDAVAVCAKLRPMSELIAIYLRLLLLLLLAVVVVVVVVVVAAVVVAKAVESSSKQLLTYKLLFILRLSDITSVSTIRRICNC
jgi:small-conductance mechanosensitive channel